MVDRPKPPQKGKSGRPKGLSPASLLIAQMAAEIKAADPKMPLAEIGRRFRVSGQRIRTLLDYLKGEK